ncbi:hypothetical protein [Thermosulfurimonas dismutans]|uniref:Uncharacterized protein n=1 Tax=Thermosulfurimonas dismutans TaxID=999894 RepID=A0A179D3Q0_9BACT|nr:hypothetical protein [Thermosulfurimonas dismutans]OAQ20339.1 hypothetical protein TDIS_1534 [Thermosulfurimonas dismutans]
MTENGELYLSIQALQDLFGRSERTLRRWASACEARKQDKNGRVFYYLPDLLRYYLEDIHQPVPEELEKIRTEREKVKLEKERLELETTKGNLIERDRVEVEWAQRAAEFRQGLIALEFKLAKQLAGRKLTLPQVREILRKEIFEILRSYAREGAYTPKMDERWSLEEFEAAYFKFLQALEKTNCPLSKIKVKLECPSRNRRAKKGGK